MPCTCVSVRRVLAFVDVDNQVRTFETLVAHDQGSMRHCLQLLMFNEQNGLPVRNTIKIGEKQLAPCSVVPALRLQASSWKVLRPQSVDSACNRFANDPLQHRELGEALLKRLKDLSAQARFREQTVSVSDSELILFVTMWYIA